MLVGTVDVIADGNLERRTLNPFSLQRDRHIACYPKECRFWEMVVDSGSGDASLDKFRLARHSGGTMFGFLFATYITSGPSRLGPDGNGSAAR